jgi:hypothetical protein
MAEPNLMTLEEYEEAYADILEVIDQYDRHGKHPELNKRRAELWRTSLLEGKEERQRQQIVLNLKITVLKKEADQVQSDVSTVLVQLRLFTKLIVDQTKL